MALLDAVAVFIIAISPAFAQQAEPTGPELLVNGGLERIDPDTGDPVGWAGFYSGDWGDCAGRALSSAHDAHSGQRCARIDNVRLRYAFGHARIPIDPATAYLLTGWIRTELCRGQSAYLAASFFGDRGWISITRSRQLRGRNAWTRVDLLLTPLAIPDGAREVQISFRVTGTSARGRAWVDDLSLRECEVPRPPDRLKLQRRRLLDMARELLLEREVWLGRLETLQRREADLRQLLDQPDSFDNLRQRHGAAVRDRSFLTHAAPSPAELHERDLDDDQVRGDIELLHELPDLRWQCFEHLGRLQKLKRRLDEYPDLRRFYLWAQLAAMRPDSPAQTADPPAPATTREFLAAVADPPGEPTGELFDLDVRARLHDSFDRGTVEITGEIAAPRPDTNVAAGLFDPGGQVVAFNGQVVRAPELSLQLDVPSPHLWFPDCPTQYVLRIGLFRDGEAADWITQRLAFRQVRTVEADVSPTMRHAWNWPLTDYTFTINGQPYFLRGTRCAEVRTFPDEAAELFDELWLDYQRSYGSFLTRLTPNDADALARRNLAWFASLAPDYDNIRTYVSSRSGLEQYRAAARSCRWAADHPLLLSIQTGNEAELAAWGADLPAVYGDDLWHVFNEVTRALRDEMQPDVPIGYVRAARFHRVLPVPRDDYCGVNQYTGRYWGRRATIAPDLRSLSHSATLDNKPIAITEWNGPKYSWATRGVSGIDEEGAAEYVFDYYENMTRTPTVISSTEFVLNWIATPLEDLTTVPLEEGLRRRAQWHWHNQKGVPWYPSIWPDLLTDTPARRAMRGFQSPLFELCEAPGRIVVAASTQHRHVARALGADIQALGKSASAVPVPDVAEFRTMNANMLLLGGIGGDQPAAVRELERMHVIGRTTGAFPNDGAFLIQRRINPFFPDRFLIVVTAADARGFSRAVEKLRAAASGLREAFCRHASRRGAIAIIDDDAAAGRAFSRYVMELPTRSLFTGRADVRTRLAPDGLLDDDESLAEHWTDLGAVVVAVDRTLEGTERELLLRLPDLGVNVVWSRAAIQRSPSVAEALDIQFGETHSLESHLPVRDWAQKPLAVPEFGDVAADRVERFSGLQPDTQQWRRGMEVVGLEPGDAWRTAATTQRGAPVVAMRSRGTAAHWVFGLDLAGAATALWDTTQHGNIHSIYDRDTACGLERPFRLVANAMAHGLQPRPADTLRLRAEILPESPQYDWGETARVRVVVRDSEGRHCDASVRVILTQDDRFLGVPAGSAEWIEAERIDRGVYAAEAALPGAPEATGATAETWQSDHRGQWLATILADVSRPNWVGDWAAETVRIGEDTHEPHRIARLAGLIEHDLAQVRLNVRDRENWIELTATLTLPATIGPGEPAPIELRIERVEDDRGNDWLEDIAIVLRPGDGGDAVQLPIAEGKYVSSVNAPIVKQHPDDCVVVTSANPATFQTTWDNPLPGRWSIALRYRYTDNYHIEDTQRLLRKDAFESAVFDVPAATQ